VLGTVYNLIRRIKRSRLPGHNLINQMYYDPQTVILKLRDIDYIVIDDCKFYANDQIGMLQRVEGNPWFRNIRPSDVVVDIGANIGAITIPLAKVAKKVYALEPLFHEELWDNIRLNELHNVVVFPEGIGPLRQRRHYEFSSKCGVANTIPFKTLKEWVGHIDFIKVDCEGCEWGLEPEEFEGIREIRIEFHIRRSHKRTDRKKLQEWGRWLAQAGYNFDIACGGSFGLYMPFTDCMVLNASQKEADC